MNENTNENKFDDYIKLLFSSTKSALFLFSDEEKDFFDNLKADDCIIFDPIVTEEAFLSYMNNHSNNIIKFDDVSSPDTYLNIFDDFYNSNDLFYGDIIKCINFIKNKISLLSFLQNSTLSSTNASFQQIDRKYAQVAKEQKKL